MQYISDIDDEDTAEEVKDQCNPTTCCIAFDNNDEVAIETNIHCTPTLCCGTFFAFVYMVSGHKNRTKKSL